MRGDVQAIGHASDIYSLGVILYQLLTGELPFQGRGHAVLLQILESEPPPPCRLRPDLAPWLETVCLRAMAKKIEERYPSMAELAAALLPAPIEPEYVPVEGAPRTPPASSTHTTKKLDPLPPRPSRKWWLVAGVAALVVLLGVVGVVLAVSGVFRVVFAKNLKYHGAFRDVGLRFTDPVGRQLQVHSLNIRP